MYTKSFLGSTFLKITPHKWYAGYDGQNGYCEKAAENHANDRTYQTGCPYAASVAFFVGHACQYKTGYGSTKAKEGQITENYAAYATHHGCNGLALAGVGRRD